MSHPERIAVEEGREAASRCHEVPVGAEASMWAAAHRRAARVVGLLAWMAALATVLTAVAILMPTLTAPSGDVPPDLLLLVALSGAATTALFRLKLGLQAGRPWARYAGLACGTLALVAFPLGTIAGCYLWWQLLFRWTDTPAEAG